MPSSDFEAAKLEDNPTIIDILSHTGLIKTNSEGRRLIQQGGVSVNDEKITDFGQVITAEDFVDGKMIIKKGKKKFHRLNLI